MPAMDSLFTETQQLIRQTARDLAQKELAPKAAEIDRAYLFPWDGIKKLGSAGLMGMVVPTDFGGAGADTTSFALATEEIAMACASTALITVAHAAACKMIMVAGNEAQKRLFLPVMASGEKLGAFAVHEEGCGSGARAFWDKAGINGGVLKVHWARIFS